MKRHIRKVLSALLSFAILCSLGQTVFAANFTDVGPSAWYAQAVGYVSENGLMSGTGGGKFSPNTPMTRAMLATVLHRMDGSPAPTSAHGFSDVPQGAYYEQAVAWAAENRIVSGIGGGRFGSESHITRQDLTVMLYRYSSFKGYDISAADSLAGFSDSSRVAGYARQAMQWAVRAGILHGDSGRLMPAGNATRAQVAVMLMNFAQNVVGTGPVPDPESKRFQITLNGQTFDGELYDNETARAFTAMLPVTLNMQELKIGRAHV